MHSLTLGGAKNVFRGQRLVTLHGRRLYVQVVGSLFEFSYLLQFVALVEVVTASAINQRG